jgi:hypothetical protein
MMALPNPTVLSAATEFRPISLRNQSRSPARSRSPVRRNEFIAKELDPILGNLSPNTTLRALQSTDTIANSSAHDAILAKSIAEASPTERELGIKAAVAAQKVRQWQMEVAQWPWPSLADAAAGKGFLQPEVHGESSQKTDLAKSDYAGSLLTATASDYEERIEEIFDGLDALDVEELKNAVLDSHSSFRLSPSSDASKTHTKDDWSQSKIKDFTALVTATIIHMLPDLANLNMLISSWDVRLTVLRQTSQLLENLRSTERGLQAAADVVANPQLGPLVTMSEVETTENILAGQVSSLGTQYDQMLDLLEGHHDSLPAEWIDRLEEIESDFAHFVVDAKRRVIRNEWLAQSKQLDSARQLPLPKTTPVRTTSQRRGVDEWLNEGPSPPRRFPSLQGLKPDNTGTPEVPALPAYESPGRTIQTGEGFDSDPEQTPLVSQGDQPFLFPPTSSRGPSRNTSQRIPARNPSQRNAHGLTLDMPQHGHRRDISEVSMADSQYSVMSGISNAEIVDARSTQVLASPKIQLVDNPMRASRDDLSQLVNDSQPRVRSMQILSREAYTRVESNPGHNRAKSLSINGPPPQYDPSQPLTSLPQGLGDFSPVIDLPTAATFEDSPLRPTNNHRASTASIEMLSRGQARQISLARPSSRDSSQLLDEYHETRSRSDTLNTFSSDELMAPGTNHQRHSDRPRDIDEADKQDGTVSQVSPTRSTDGHRDSFLDEASSSDNDTFTGVGENLAPAGSLEAKIQSILTTLPTRIRLARESDDSDSPGNPSSTTSTRSSTPAPFTLSPVRPDRSARGAVNDTDVKVYHLRWNGQSKETKPTKLFVRRVGDDGRVMVRVGGGWADLGEYLREYSLHHGRRGIANGHFEVANLPNSGQREVPDVPALPGSSVNRSRSSSSRSPSSALAFDFGSLTSIPKTRQNFTPDFSGPSADDYAAIARSPEPPLSVNHTTFAPPALVTTNANGSASSTLDLPAQPTNSTNSHTTLSDGRTPTSISSTTTSPIVSTTTAPPLLPLSSNQNYTPLGAAGPKTGNRRVTTHGGTSTAENEAWVDNLVGKARAVSGGPRAGMPQTVTTTAKTPASRRASGNFLNSSPGSVQSNSSHISQSMERVPSLTKDKDLQTGGRENGGVSGIRRVFLRKKSRQG